MIFMQQASIRGAGIKGESVGAGCGLQALCELVPDCHQQLKPDSEDWMPGFDVQDVLACSASVSRFGLPGQKTRSVDYTAM